MTSYPELVDSIEEVLAKYFNISIVVPGPDPRAYIDRRELANEVAGALTSERFGWIAAETESGFQVTKTDTIKTNSDVHHHFEGPPVDPNQPPVFMKIRTMCLDMAIRVDADPAAEKIVAMAGAFDDFVNGRAPRSQVKP